MCDFQIWIADFDFTITLVPQQLQSPFTTHFKATRIGVNMNAVSVSQSITIRRWIVMNKWVQYFGTPCTIPHIGQSFFYTSKMNLEKHLWMDNYSEIRNKEYEQWLHLCCVALHVVSIMGTWTISGEVEVVHISPHLLSRSTLCSAVDLLLFQFDKYFLAVSSMNWQ